MVLDGNYIENEQYQINKNNKQTKIEQQTNKLAKWHKNYGLIDLIRNRNNHSLKLLRMWYKSNI